jgi:hypothetical protein
MKDIKIGYIASNGRMICELVMMRKEADMIFIEAGLLFQNLYVLLRKQRRISAITSVSGPKFEPGTSLIRDNPIFGL